MVQFILSVDPWKLLGRYLFSKDATTQRMSSRFISILQNKRYPSTCLFRRYHYFSAIRRGVEARGPCFSIYTFQTF